MFLLLLVNLSILGGIVSISSVIKSHPWLYSMAIRKNANSHQRYHPSSCLPPSYLTYCWFSPPSGLHIPFKIPSYGTQICTSRVNILLILFSSISQSSNLTSAAEFQTVSFLCGECPRFHLRSLSLGLQSPSNFVEFENKNGPYPSCSISLEDVWLAAKWQIWVKFGHIIPVRTRDPSYKASNSFESKQSIFFKKCFACRGKVWLQNYIWMLRRGKAFLEMKASSPMSDPWGPLM